MAKRVKRKGTKRNRAESINVVETFMVDDLGELELVVNEKSVRMVPHYVEILRQQRGIRSIDPDSPMAYQNDRIVKSFVEQGMSLSDAVDSAAIYYEDEGGEIFNTALIISMLDSNFEAERTEEGVMVFMKDHLEDVEINREDDDPELIDYLQMMGQPNVRARNRSNPVEQKVSLVDEIARMGGAEFTTAIRDLLKRMADEVASREGGEEIDEAGFHPDSVDGVLDAPVDTHDENEASENAG